MEELAFCKKVEKRIRKYVRINKLFRKGDKILVTDKFSMFVVKSIIKDLPVSIVLKNVKIKGIPDKKVEKIAGKGKINKIVLPWTLEDEVCMFLETFFSKKPDYSMLGVNVGKYVKLFRTIVEDEAIRFAKCKGFEIKPRKQDEFTKMLDKIEAKHQETRFSLLKSIDALLK